MTFRGRVESGQVVIEPPDLLPEGAKVSIEVIQPGPEAAADRQSLDSTENVSSGPTGLIGMSLSSDALSFCREKGLFTDLSPGHRHSQELFLDRRRASRRFGS